MGIRLAIMNHLLDLIRKTTFADNKIWIVVDEINGTPLYYPLKHRKDLVIIDEERDDENCEYDYPEDLEIIYI